MTPRPSALAAVLGPGVLTAAATLASGGMAIQTPDAPRVLASVLEADGAPVTGLGREALTLTADGAPREVISVVSAPSTVQVAVVFEGLAASSQLVSGAITAFMAALTEDSQVDVFSVADNLATTIDEAVTDLQDRGASRPVVLLLGQAVSLQQSRAGLTIARGVAGDVEDTDPLATRLLESGTLFYGVSVTDAPLDQLVRLATRTGGRFEVLPSSELVIDRVTGIARELSNQYLLTYAPPAADRAGLSLRVVRDGVTARLGPPPRP